MSSGSSEKIKRRVTLNLIYQWRKRRPDLSDIEFDEMVRLHDMRLLFIETGQTFEPDEWQRYKELHIAHVVELTQGCDSRFTVGFTVPTITEYAPQIWRSRAAAQKVADWLCASCATLYRSPPVRPPQGPSQRYSTASDQVPSIMKRQAD